MRIVRNLDSWIPLEENGARIPPYRRTFIADGQEYINDYHERFASCPLQNEAIIEFGIAGWLRREDALKLYELAYYIDGEILELGCYEGLSTTIMARALEDAKKKSGITSVDNKLRRLFSTGRNLKSRGLRQLVRLKWGDARRVCKRLIRAQRR